MPNKQSSAVLQYVQRLKAFTDFESTRYALCYILVDPANRRLVASDSRTLIVIPLERCEGEESFMLDAALLDYTARVKDRLKCKSDLVAKLDGDTVSLSFEHDGKTVGFSHPLPEGQFPEVDEVLPPYEGEFSFDIRLDARFLNRVTEHAIESMKDDIPHIRFQFRGNEDGVLVTLLRDYTEMLAQYVVMPISQEKQYDV